jgi:hypothetical protein
MVSFTQVSHHHPLKNTPFMSRCEVVKLFIMTDDNRKSNKEA